ncbi:MAG: tRNA (adenosine(37)-N6)-threonylcarbamoyltransferase complex dimerization subunit type 1 TsaB [Gammaproteobacteria bacterium]|nr:tRNA (adenosine(37)-N6)-threonylcarbamoyltransferase complex dimerization subunit type 1 TsaB [Gammaproteobacteria bacterium]
MKILAFDTSTQQCSVALLCGNEIKDISLDAPNQHAELLLPLIHRLLHEAGLSLTQLNAIGFSRGPGSFTGLRIAASLAQGLACAHDIPVAAISTLQMMAQATHLTQHAERIAVAMDARMQQIYWGTFAGTGIMLPTCPEQVLSPNEVILAGKDWTAVGTAWQVYSDSLLFLQPQLAHIDTKSLPQARNLIPLAQYQIEQKLTVSAENALPIYLRDKVC